MSREERTGWRDEDMSNRHRTWGHNCPMVDVDFLALEYDLAEPVALVEYKATDMLPFAHASYKALRKLAQGYKNKGIPFFVVRYWHWGDEKWAFEVYPQNKAAYAYMHQHQPDYAGEMMTEKQWVTILYHLRQLQRGDEQTLMPSYLRLCEELPR